MILFFSIVIVVGLLWLLVELGAKNASVAPSMYQINDDGWLLVIVGVVGIICVWWTT